MDDLTADELWDLVIENDRAIAGLAPNDYAARFQLAMRGDELRSQLRHLQAEAIATSFSGVSAP